MVLSLYPIFLPSQVLASVGPDLEIPWYAVVPASVLQVSNTVRPCSPRHSLALCTVIEEEQNTLEQEMKVHGGPDRGPN